MSRFESIDATRLRWFTAVAEELHFARAAKSLNISRQRLSRAVIDLEAELGVRLFVPGAQPTELTEDGRALLAAAPGLLEAAEVVTESVPGGAVSLRLGFVPGVTVSKWTRIWGERFPDVPLDVTPVPQAGQLAALREHEVDMCFVRLPIEDDGLGVIPLYREVPVVVVPKDHPISVFTEVSTADLADERMQREHELDDAAVTLEMVAAGVGHVVVPHSIARLHARRDLVYRPVTDAPDTGIALAWPTGSSSAAIEDFIGVVRGRSERSSRATTSTDPASQRSSAAKPTTKAAAAKGNAAKPTRNTAARKRTAPKSTGRRGR